MKEIEFRVKETGVKTYIVSDDGKNVVNDIDIDDSIETLVFGLNENEIFYDLEGANKVFPNVKNFIIMPAIECIKISNKMFPNVRTIVSYSAHYRTDSYLIYHQGLEDVLVNSFCLHANEILDLRHVTRIASYALDGCKAENIEYNENIPLTLMDNCFVGSRYNEEPFVDGIKSYNGFMIDIDKGAKDVVFSEDIHINSLAEVRMIHSLIIRKASALYDENSCIFSNIEAQELIIDFSGKPRQPDIVHVCDMLHAHYVEMGASVRGIFSNDGILYTDQGKTLSFIPRARTEPVVIPDGVVSVGQGAGCFTNISSIEFPQSLQTIHEGGFRGSSLKSVKFNGSTFVGLRAFSCCVNLINLILPSTTMITSGSFGDCKNLQRIRIPASVKNINSGNFSYVNEFVIEGADFPDGIITYERFCRTVAISNKNYITLKWKGHALYIPLSIDSSNLKEIKHKIIQGEVEGFYRYAQEKNMKLDTAIAEALNNNTKKSRAYVRRAGKAIVNMYLDKCDSNDVSSSGRDVLMHLIEEALMTESTLKYLLAKTDDVKDITLRAYALNKLNNLKPSKTCGFAL